MSATTHTAGDGRPNPWRIAAWTLAGLVLLLPLVAMQFTAEVNWTVGDFIFAALLIGGTGVLFELAARATRNWSYRGGVVLVVMAAFLLIWINGAVGIIGDEDNPLNLLYLGIIALSLSGSVIARFRAEGMAVAMTVAAAAQAAMIVVALIYGRSEPPGPFGLVVLNGFFVALYLGSAWLFRRAARRATGSTP